MRANVERPTEAFAGSLLLFSCAGFALIAGIAASVEGGAWGLIDVFIGVLLGLSGYLIYQMRHLAAGTTMALVVGIAITMFFIFAEVISGGILVEGIIPVIAGILGFVARGKSKTMQKMPIDLLGVVKLHERIKISELAARFKTTELEIELSVIKLQEKGDPIGFDKETREVIYKKRE